MFKFNIGDEIEVKFRAPYTITVSGSKGIIINRKLIDGDPFYYINWKYVPGDHKVDSHWKTFDISESYLKLLSKDLITDNPHNKKYELIIRKMHQLYAKQSFKFKES